MKRLSCVVHDLAALLRLRARFTIARAPDRCGSLLFFFAPFAIFAVKSLNPKSIRCPLEKHKHAILLPLMDASRIAELLKPFLASPDGPVAASTAETPPIELSSVQLDRISIYIDILLRWNARINLTAVRNPEEIVTRHFGESLFAARHLLPRGENPGGQPALGAPVAKSSVESGPIHDSTGIETKNRMVDLGSGAGFPGLPIKIWSPKMPVTLIESNQKKVAFLREAVRALTLTDIDVFPGRAEDYPQASASLVTLRAVERFEAALITAARIATQRGRLALLVGEPQVDTARHLLAEHAHGLQNPAFAWDESLHIPGSQSRVLRIGRRI